MRDFVNSFFGLALCWLREDNPVSLVPRDVIAYSIKPILLELDSERWRGAWADRKCKINSDYLFLTTWKDRLIIFTRDWIAFLEEGILSSACATKIPFAICGHQGFPRKLVMSRDCVLGLDREDWIHCWDLEKGEQISRFRSEESTSNFISGPGGAFAYALCSSDKRHADIGFRYEDSFCGWQELPPWCDVVLFLHNWRDMIVAVGKNFACVTHWAYSGPRHIIPLENPPLLASVSEQEACLALVLDTEDSSEACIQFYDLNDLSLRATSSPIYDVCHRTKTCAWDEEIFFVSEMLWYVWAFNSRTGETVASFNLPPNFRSTSAAVAEGKLYFGNDRGEYVVVRKN